MVIGSVIRSPVHSAINAALLGAPRWWTSNAIFDLDYQNSRFYASATGASYASVAAMVSAGLATQTGGIDRFALSSLPSAFTFAGKATTAASTVSTARYIASMDDGSDATPADELVTLAQILDVATPRLQSSIFAGGVTQTPAVPAFTSTTGAGNSAEARIAIRVKANDAAISIGGGTVENDPTVTMPVVTQLVVGNRDDGLRPWLGTIKRVVLIGSAISDADLPSILA